jgi:hypothetical protein
MLIGNMKIGFENAKRGLSARRPARIRCRCDYTWAAYVRCPMLNTRLGRNENMEHMVRAKMNGQDKGIVESKTTR